MTGSVSTTLRVDVLTSSHSARSKPRDSQFNESDNHYPDQCSGESREHIGRVMYAEINTRESDQKYNYRCDRPNKNVNAAIPDTSREDHRQGPKETETRQRMTTGKTKRFGRKQVKERNGPGPPECQLERCVQDSRAHYRDSE